MDSPDNKYGFIKNKICPYCQSKIKSGSEFTVCSHCGTPHHRECWEENSGCATYGCLNNPQTKEKVNVNSEDIGNETLDSIRESLQRNAFQNLINCPNCNSEVEEGSTYCKFCGYNLIENKFDDAKNEFEKEYKRRYKNKIGITRKRFLITLGSFVILISALAFLFYITVTKLNQYFSSDEFKIQNTVNNWKDAWENKDINKLKSYMTDDYLYFGKDGKSVDLKERIKRLEASFKNNNEIKINFSDFRMIDDSSTTVNDRKVRVNQNYESGKIQEKGVKTLRLYRGDDTNGEWKIYREFFD